MGHDQLGGIEHHQRANYHPVSSAPTPTTTPVSSAPTPSPSPNAYIETVGGVTHTWTDYGGGGEEPSIAKGHEVQVTCRVQGFAVADGNTWWYKIASSLWSNSNDASADAFYNNGSTSGSLANTPFFDPTVPVC